MSETITRRAAIGLAAGAGLASSVPVVQLATSNAVAFPLTHDCDPELLELRRAIDAYQAAVRVEMELEGHPGYQTAIDACNAREAECDALIEAVYERTPVALRDVALRAESLRMYFFNGPRQACAELAGCKVDRAFARLYEAAVVVG